MAALDPAADITLHEAREVAQFIYALAISAHELELIAILTGWQKRAPREITPAAPLTSLCAQCFSGTASFNDIAAGLDGVAGGQPSRQSVAERFAEPCLRMIQTVLRLAINQLLGLAFRAGGLETPLLIFLPLHFLPFKAGDALWRASQSSTTTQAPHFSSPAAAS